MTDDRRPPDELSGPPPAAAEAYPAPPPNEPGGIPAHAVPATPLGEASHCLRCGTENRPGIAFCRNCGQRITEPGVASSMTRPGTPLGMTACPRCGHHNRADGSFCASCGGSLRSAAAPEQVEVPAPQHGRAVLGPVVLVLGAIGVAVAWVLPFADAGSLYDRAFGAPGGYGIAFWNGYGTVGRGLAGEAYFGLAAPAPILVLLLFSLAAAGVVHGSPGRLQRVGLAVGLIWSVGLAVGFAAVEVLGRQSSDVVETLRALSPGGIIFLLAGFVAMIGAAVRLTRS